MTKSNGRRRKWTGLIPIEPTPEQKMSRVIAVYQNDLAIVFIKEAYSPSFIEPEGEPQLVIHLMIQWAKGLNGSDEYFYDLKQRIKSELCGKDSECVELIPGKWREQDLKQTHLWVLGNGGVVPIGLVPKDVQAAMEKSAGGQENVLVKEDLEVFVVEHPPEGDGDPVLEVFASNDEFEAAYSEISVPDGVITGVRMIGSVPVECENVGWTDSAKVKVANVVAKADAGNVDHVEPQLFYDKDTIEDDIEEAVFGGDVADGPSGLEEGIAITDAMEEAMEGVADDRARMVREVSEEVVGKKSISEVKSKLIVVN